MDGRQKPDPQPENGNDLDDDEVIDLTQILEGQDDEIIELKDILEQPAEEEPIIDLLDAMAPEPKGAAAAGDADEEFTDLESRAQAILNDASVSSQYEAPEPPPLTEQQIEDALERVIKKIYGEKIEHLLIQTIDKTIRREIEKIKNALLEDGDGMIE